MYTLPKGLTASTGLDALTHAIEGLITKGSWEMSDMFEIKAIEMIARYLETAVFEPTNAEARNEMCIRDRTMYQYTHVSVNNTATVCQ